MTQKDDIKAKCDDIRIKTNGLNTQIDVNGVTLKGVREFTLHQKACGIQTLTLDLYAMNAEVSGCAMIFDGLAGYKIKIDHE